MPFWPFYCDTCAPPQHVDETDDDFAQRFMAETAAGSRVEIFHQTSAGYGPEMFPICPYGHGPMVRSFQDGAKIAHRSKGVFPCELADLQDERLGDTGPVRCEDYQDYKRKLKERHLVEKEPSKNTASMLKELRRGRRRYF